MTRACQALVFLVVAFFVLSLIQLSNYHRLIRVHEQLITEHTLLQKWIRDQNLNPSNLMELEGEGLEQ